MLRQNYFERRMKLSTEGDKVILEQKIKEMQDLLKGAKKLERGLKTLMLVATQMDLLSSQIKKEIGDMSFETLTRGGGGMTSTNQELVEDMQSDVKSYLNSIINISKDINNFSSASSERQIPFLLKHLKKAIDSSLVIHRTIK